MGIFKRKKSKFSPEQSDVEPLQYSGFQQTMIETVSLGSKDSKVVTIAFEDDKTIHFTVAAGRIKHANDGEDVKSLGKLKWAEVGTLTPEDIAAITEIVEASPYCRAIARIKDELSPEIAVLVSEVFDNNSIRLMELADNSTIIKTDMDWVLGADSKHIEAYSTLSLDVSEIDTLLQQREETFQKVSRFLEGNSLADVILSANESADYHSAVSDEERIVIVAANNNNNLEELLQNSAGFDWNLILKAIETLMWKSQIKATIPTADENFDEFNLSQDEFNNLIKGENATPENLDVDSQENETESTDVDELSEFDESVSSDGQISVGAGDDLEDDGWRFAKPDEIEGPDDGGFNYEVVEDEGEGFTQNMDLNLREPIGRLLYGESILDEDRAAILSAVDYNEDLEFSVNEIESQIIPARKEYEATFGEYQGLAIQVVIEQMGDGEESFDKNEVESVRSESNDSWFNLEKLETKRAHVNGTRHDILTRLRSKLIELPGAHVQEVIHRIDEKLDGIKKVVNVAFHDKKDDEEERYNVDLALLDDRLLRRYDKRDTPLFFTVSHRLGFNPFEQDSEQLEKI